MVQKSKPPSTTLPLYLNIMFTILYIFFVVCFSVCFFLYLHIFLKNLTITLYYSAIYFLATLLCTTIYCIHFYLIMWFFFGLKMLFFTYSFPSIFFVILQLFSFISFFLLCGVFFFIYFL